jgi:putative spermidine/putrescine transport system substrate-binding protein
MPPAARPTRRDMLTLAAASVATLALPRRSRAASVEVPIGGPAGAAKYFAADIFPLIEAKLGIKILYDGSNSLTNLQKMQASRDAPTLSVVIMDDPVMIRAADENLIVPLTPAAVPNLDKLVHGAVHRDGLWANYQRPWAGIAYSTTALPTPPKSWTELWDTARFAQKVILPSLQNTEGFWALLAAAHLETGKPFAEAQYEIDAAFRKLKALKPNLLNVYVNAPQAMNLLEQGDAAMIGGQFSAYTLTRKDAGAPVDLAIPSEGGFAMPSGIAKVKGGPSPELAEAVIDAFLSPEVQAVLAAKAHVAPTHSAAKAPAGIPESSTLFAPDWAFVAKERAGWVERWTKEMA